MPLIYKLKQLNIYLAYIQIILKKKAKAITAVFYWNISLYLKVDILKEFKKLYI